MPGADKKTTPAGHDFEDEAGHD